MYKPIINLFKINQLKWKLDDCFFRYLHLNKYMYISQLIDERRVDRELYINKFIDNLYQAIEKQGVHSIMIYGRPKHIYSIWRKMQKKSLKFNQLFDVLAVRIIAKRLNDCYIVLKIVHQLYHNLSSEFDDYIANPKPNGYQSIHTVIYGPKNRIVEIQIRTNQMHKNAELGMAAHWRYKKESYIDDIFVNAYNVLKYQ